MLQVLALRVPLYISFSQVWMFCLNDTITIIKRNIMSTSLTMLFLFLPGGVAYLLQKVADSDFTGAPIPNGKRIVVLIW
jgi:hypothetical protein